MKNIFDAILDISFMVLFMLTLIIGFFKPSLIVASVLLLIAIVIVKFVFLPKMQSKNEVIDNNIQE